MATHYIFFKRDKQRTVGTGFCSLMIECPQLITFRNVSGTITITDNVNTLVININEGIATVPTIVGDNVSGPIPVGIREIRRDEGQGRNIRQYELKIGKSFSTQFVVKDYQFAQMAKEVKIAGDGVAANVNDCNVINILLSFNLEGEMTPIRKF